MCGGVHEASDHGGGQLRAAECAGVGEMGLVEHRQRVESRVPLYVDKRSDRRGLVIPKLPQYVRNRL